MKKPAAKSPKKTKKERVMPILLLLRARVQQNLSRKIQNHLQQNFLQQKSSYWEGCEQVILDHYYQMAFLKAPESPKKMSAVSAILY